MVFRSVMNKDHALEWLVGLKQCLQGLEWFINCGTLLGAVRDGDFIDWDLDIDVAMKRKHENKFQDIIKCLRAKGYTANYVICRDLRPEIKELQHFIQITYKGISGHLGVRSPKQYIGRGYFTFGKVMLRGVEFPCPGNVEKYLEEKYGKDWKTPKPRRGWKGVSRNIRTPTHPVPEGAWHD